MEVPGCPSGHAGATVVRAGWYGKAGARRQRFKCCPADGSAPHRFSEVLPRIAVSAAAHHCPECATLVEPWEGQPAPRLYGFTARDVAAALVEVARGSTYRAAAARARARAGRELSKTPTKTPRGRRIAEPNRHGQLVSDWVDTFAPVLWSALGAREWPKWLLLDDAKLTYTSKRGRTLDAFHLLTVVGYDGPGSQRVVAVEAVPTTPKQYWPRLLKALPGQPELLVADAGTAGKAGRSRWPEASFHRCEWHLAKNLREALPKAVQADSSDPLHALVGRAATSPQAWAKLRDAVDERASTQAGWTHARRSVQRIGSIVQAQAVTRLPGQPGSTGPVEQFQHAVRRTIGDRAGLMTNKHRADALLKLLALEHNGLADEHVWAQLIRDWLTSRPDPGHAPHQRQHTDCDTTPSLRTTTRAQRRRPTASAEPEQAELEEEAVLEVAGNADYTDEPPF